MVITSRHKVIEYLKNREAATALDISRALKTTPANARHHLSSLLEEGVVQITGERTTNEPGRPSQIYALTLSSNRHNLDRLSTALLDLAQDPLDQQHSESIFLRVAQRLAAPPLSTNNMTQRLNQVVQRLNQMGYNARWEAHAAGPRLILGHCPYAAILTKHPGLCEMDAVMLSELLNRSVVLESRLEPTSTGLPQCNFRIAK